MSPAIIVGAGVAPLVGGVAGGVGGAMLWKSHRVLGFILGGVAAAYVTAMVMGAVAVAAVASDALD